MSRMREIRKKFLVGEVYYNRNRCTTVKKMQMKIGKLSHCRSKWLPRYRRLEISFGS
ncbi:unnamed protein product [Acanthoscelides obtectus]|uniref:Uncharacterized protein n=1 Tax=Acanthoscelides obtectus TaxID=200917 RepID=A0A9P0M9W6_ACAOB|nr:unnamed protein product [Acanthoscelides obtectus]CAK1658393.1 hypothetical protein AOBTE_LOCUS20856 [Acanthoscelides obtectus]